ncbi:MAG: RecX family transcriptional regulator [Ignavibacteria bacterium]|jgi:regulatory protein|nr:RecX family transcriptional regulator [Ignavibacteria bacterium]
MKITSIEHQKKDGRFNIFIDGEFAFGLYRETVYNFGLRVNDELTQEEIDRMRTEDELNFGKKVAFRYLNYKPRSEKEVRTKLHQKKISEKTIDEIITVLKDLKFIDDANYAKMYVESKVTLKPEGRRVLKMKLAGKGIEKELSLKTVEENYTEETEIRKAKDLINKYSKRVKAKNPADKKQKIYRHLLSKGFSFDVISRVLKIEED